jgi:hypothetical protein
MMATMPAEELVAKVPCGTECQEREALFERVISDSIDLVS